MMEPAVTLTNFLLTLECWAFALALRGAMDATYVLVWFSRLFAALGLGALLGGVTHGFVPEDQVLANRVVWSANMLALGAAGAATAMIASKIALPAWRHASFALVVAVLALVYAAVILFVAQDFYIALLAAVVPVVVLLVLLIRLYGRTREAGVLLAVAGLAVNLLGGVQQQMQIGIDPETFNHNAVFHVIQMLAFGLLFLGSRPTAQAVAREA